MPGPRGELEARPRPPATVKPAAVVPDDPRTEPGSDLALVDSAAAARVVAVVRALLIVAIGAGALIDDRPGLYHLTFVVVLGAAAVYAIAALVMTLHQRRRPLAAAALVDVIVLAVLAHASGGAYSEVRFAFFAIPVLAAMLFAPRATAVLSVVVVATYLTLSLTHPGGDGVQDRQLLYVEVVYLAWTAVAAALLSSVLTRRASVIAGLAQARGKLMVEVLDAEDRERRRLANWLHDGAVQDLLVAGQDLAEAERGNAAALKRAGEIVRATVPQLRNVLADLHPSLLTGAGLQPALEAVAAVQARSAGFETAIVVEEEAEGLHDQLLLSLARELMINIVKHAQAGHVRISVHRRRDGLELEVRDDGHGFDVALLGEAVGQGHIGLASATERVESLGGRLELDSTPGQGTRVRVFIPDVAV